MAEQKEDRNFFGRLRKLFSSTAIVRIDDEGKRKVVDVDERQMNTNLLQIKDRYTKLQRSFYETHAGAQSMAYHQVRRELFRDYDCIHGDTVIPLPDGTYPTIKELSEKYKDNPNERFFVFSYDHKTNSIKLGEAFHPRYKGKQYVYKVTFDNDEYIIATADHLFLRRDGEYVKLKDLQPSDSLMPFYRKDFYDKGYKHIYDFDNGWVREHNLVAEQFYRNVSADEVVHHKDFNCKNNLPTNLQIMTKAEHRRYHSEVMNGKIWSAENRDRQIEAIRLAVKKRKPFNWNGARSGKNNPFYGKLHTKARNTYISECMKEYHKTVDVSGKNNANYRDDISYDTILNTSIGLLSENQFTKKKLQNTMGCDVTTIDNRILTHHQNWGEFKNYIYSKLNHKVKSIEFIGDEDVYDLSVDKYHNFATTNVFIHNCMDNDPIIASALDIYADESTTKDEFGQVLTIRSSNENVKEILHNLFYDILNIEFNIWPWTRNLVKYGDFFLGLEIAEGKGVINIVPQSVYYSERIEGFDPNNANYVKFKVEQDRTGKTEWENYEMAHFRLLSDTNFLPYGKSMIESARRIWKQLSLMEDAMLIHRIMRAPEKRIFKIDIGNINPTEVDNYMQKIINKMKKVPFVDKNSGDYNLKYNMQNLTEDFFLPVRGGDSGTSIDNLGGLEYAATEDIEFLQKKLFAALRVPKAYLSYDENVNGKATLAAEDVRFARTIERIQRTIVSELTKIAIVHLAAQGIDDSEMVNFELSLTNASTIYEQEKVNLWTEKVRLATDIQSLKMLSKDWVYSNVFGMSDSDKDDERGKIINDLKDTFRYTSIESEGNDPASQPEPKKVEDELEELKKEIQSNSSKDVGGRPKEGNTYGKDKHPYGRDPLGYKENHKERKRETFNTVNSKKIAREYINGISAKKKIINEKRDLLDEKNLLDDDKF
jgi:hypothetical protein